MKKVYSKPCILIENFTLSTSIAGNCEKPFNLQAKYVCGIPDDNGLGMNIFSTNAGGNCVVPGNDNTTTHDGLCYHVPTPENLLFTS